MQLIYYKYSNYRIYFIRACFSMLFAVINLQSVHGQGREQQISISYNKATLEEIFILIEAQSAFRFYYVTDWLPAEPFSGEFKNVSIETILDSILDKIILNYYITPEQEVILIKNALIYDSLPEGFFGNPELNNVAQPQDQPNDNQPIFLRDPISSGQDLNVIIKIGKQDKNDKRSKFILDGKVINSSNKAPVSDVVLVTSGMNGDHATLTDKNGYFKMALSRGLNIIEIRSLELENVKQKILMYNDGSFTFKLNEAITELDEVILENPEVSQVENLNTGVTEINPEELKNIPVVLGERDVFKTAAAKPGITNAGEGASGYNVRGGKTDQNLILLDNGVLYNPLHFFGIFSAINPYTIKEMTIYKGHIPVNFGGRIASVFDIRSKQPSTEKFKGEASIGPVTSNVVLELPVVKQKSGLMVGGRSTYSNWIIRSLDEEGLYKSNASFYDVFLKYKQDLNTTDKLTVSAYLSDDGFSITSDSIYNYNNRMVSFQWKKVLNESTELNVTLSNSHYGFQLEFDGQTNNNFELGYVIDETKSQLDFNKRLNNEHELNYGLMAKFYSLEPGYIEPTKDDSIIIPKNVQDEQGIESAIYLADRYKISDALIVDVGARFSLFSALGKSSVAIYEPNVPKTDATRIETRDYGSFEFIKIYAAPEFRMSSRYIITRGLSLKGSVNTNYQYIHSLSTNTTASPIDTWKLSDHNIKPQRSLQYSLGVFKDFSDYMYEVSLEGYFKRANNILDYKVGAQLLLNEKLEQDVLQGKGKSYGVELFLKKTKGKWNGWIGYTYSRSFIKLDSQFDEERVNGGAYFPANYDKPHDVNVYTNFKLTKRFSFSGSFVFQTGRPVTIPVGKFIINNTELVVFSDRNEYRIPDYFRLDLGVNIEGNHRIKKLAHSFWNISVYNVLGRNNPYSVFFVTEDGQIKAYQSSIFSIPIPTISYNLKF